MEDDSSNGRSSSICPTAFVVSSTTTTAFNHHYRDHHDGDHHHIRAHISTSPSQQRRLRRRRPMASSDLPQQQLCSTDLQDSSSASLEACECQCLFISKQQQQQQQTLTLGCSSVSSPASFNSSSTTSLPLSPEKCSSSQQWQLRDEEEDEMFPFSFETKSAVVRTASKFSHPHLHHPNHYPNHHPLPRRCSSSSSNTSSSIFSRFPLILLLSLFLLLTLATTGGHCDTPNSGHLQLNDREEGGNGSFQFPGYSSSSPKVPNRTLTLMQLSQLMRSGSGSGGNGLPRKIRQPAPISHYQFCEEPPLVPNAISHLKRNQKHSVFPLGQVSSYMCVQGYRAVGGETAGPVVAETRCSLPDPENSSPPMAPTANGGSQFFFPGDSLPKSSAATDDTEAAHVVLLGSARSKNSKRLADSAEEHGGDLSDEEPVLNSASNPNGGHRSSVVSFPGPWRSSKSGRKAADQVGAEADLLSSMYDASPTIGAGTGTGSAGGGAADHALEWHSTSADSLERRKQKMEKSLRSGRPRWWPPVTLNCQPVTCADPGQVENAVRVHQSPGQGNSSSSSSSSNAENVFTFNSNVHYVCKEGYETAGGIPLLTCRANGQWNREPPRCRLKQCPPLPPLENGRILYSSTERRTDSRAEYHCNAGYRLNAPNSVRLCGADDRWSSLVMAAESEEVEEEGDQSTYRCVLIQCPPPARPPGIRVLNLGKARKTGSSSTKNYSPGDVIIFTCDSMKTRATAKCRADGEWSREPPHCPPVTPACGPLPHFPHGSINVSATRATFSCFEGFQLVGGPAVVSCNAKGVWSDAIPSCVVVEKGGGKSGDQALTNGSSSANQNEFASEHSSGDPEEKKKEKSLTKTLTLLLVTIGLVLFGIFLAGGWFVMRVRRDKKTRKRWQEYFGRYQHRQSKTHIVMSTTNNFGGGGGGGGGSSSAAAIAAAAGVHHGGGGKGVSSSASRGLLSGGGNGQHGHRHSGAHQQANHHHHDPHNKGNYLLQTTSSFSSSDNETVAAASDRKSIFTSGTTGTINSDHGARTVSSYAEDGDTTAGEDHDQESTFYDEEEEEELDLDDDDLYSLRMKGLAPSTPTPIPASRQRNAINPAAAAAAGAQLQVNTNSAAAAEMKPIIQLHSPKNPKSEHIYSNVPYAFVAGATPQPLSHSTPPPSFSAATQASANPSSKPPVPVTEL